MHIACLDTESTSTGRYNEILELAIYSARGELVLNSLYKPKRNRRWPHSEKVHGISPDMVQDKPHFQDCLRKIQKIFDRCQMILGFALDNDVRILEQSGIKGLTPERCLDVRELFWGVYRDELQMDFYHVPSLIKCAEFCGYVWEEGSAHSAAADALRESASLMIDSLIPMWELADTEIEEPNPELNNVIYQTGNEDDEAADASGRADVLDRPIEDLELNVRPANCMKRAGIVTIGDLIQKTDEEVKTLRNLGSKSFDEIVDKLAERGLKLKKAE